MTYPESAEPSATLSSEVAGDGGVADRRTHARMSSADVDTKGRLVGVSDQRWSKLLEFCLINEEDMALLYDAAPLAELAGEVSRSFYDHILEQPELRRIIEQNTSIEKLRGSLERYFRTFFTGRVDDARMDGVLKSVWYTIGSICRCSPTSAPPCGSTGSCSRPSSSATATIR